MEIADDDVIAGTREVVAIAELSAWLAGGLDPAQLFSEAERRYAHSKSDPDRRLAARLATKRAARRLLGDDIGLSELEVVRHFGRPPALKLSAVARARLLRMGAGRTLLSLTHGQTHAAAAVLLLRDG